MTTYLLTWNPENFAWTGLDDTIRQVRQAGQADDNWSSGATKQIEPGSRFFLTRLGGEPRGLIGSGIVLTSPSPQPHWNDEKRARGETSLNVEVRFDVLERFPIVRRLELGAEEFARQQWDPQASGIRIDTDIAARLESLWKDRTGGSTPTEYHLPSSVSARWKSHWNALTSNHARMEAFRARDERRRTVAPEIAALIGSFGSGSIDLAEFREVFDRRTRNEWDVFGLKGLSGAMFLNKLAKHIPDQALAARALRDVLAVPETDEQATGQIDAFLAFLTAVIQRGEASASEIQPNRTIFFVSACWHLQALERWPTFYESARKTYASEGIFVGGPVIGDAYVEFAALTSAIARNLGVDLWSVEHICTYLGESPLAEKPPSVIEPVEEPDTQRVWLFAPGADASQWDAFYDQGVAAIGWPRLGDLTQYRDLADLRDSLQRILETDRNPMHQALACWEFAHEMQPGDVVFAKKGRKHIIGYGIVKSAYRHEAARGEYPNVRDVEWRKRGEWTVREKPLVIKTLTDIGGYAGLVQQIRTALEIGTDGETSPGKEKLPPGALPPTRDYTKADALRDLFVEEHWLDRAMQLLRYKRNLVLQGPPGVGKTFVAHRLAYLLLGQKDLERVQKVQFHASYSYEDFVQGYRPNGTGFERVDGPFWELCDEALQDRARPYVFMIDEINRGNLSKIFGELLMLLEGDKRSGEWAVRLTYSRSDEPPFFVPPNVYVIGTMNTADRSLAMVDYALRRRFAFIDVPPAIGSKSFDDHLAAMGAGTALRSMIVERLAKLNDEIGNDGNLGPGFAIGHSYFCHVGEGSVADRDWFDRIIDTEIEPLLREYWFDDRERADERAARLRED